MPFESPLAACATSAVPSKPRPLASVVSVSTLTVGSLNVNNNQNCAAFFGEAGLVGYFQITKHVSASGGYQVMWINGVAQPVSQISGTNLQNSSASLDVSSGIFYHGATAGLEVNW